MASLQNVFSIDIEDWFHILDIPRAYPMSEWDRLESGVERNLENGHRELPR